MSSSVKGTLGTTDDCHAGIRAGKQTKHDLEALLSKELQHHGYNDVQPIENNLDTKRRGVFKASKDKAQVAMRVYTLRSGISPQDICAEVLSQSGLHHPHIVQPKSLIRTPNFLCVALEYADGGDVYRLARRAGAHGLPLPAARFIFQQLVLTVDYAHEYGIFLCRINPSNVLVFWNDRGMPILKLADFRLSRPRVKIKDPRTPVIGTMYTSPHLIRLAESEAARDLPEEKIARAADIWSVCVTFYFLLYARWPFDKRQIAAWADMPAHMWHDDDMIDYPVKDRPDAMEPIVKMMKEVFEMGRLSLVDFVNNSKHTIVSIQQATWFRIDLPAGALEMKGKYMGKTAERRASDAYTNLEKQLNTAVSPGVQNLSHKMQNLALRDAPSYS